MANKDIEAGRRHIREWAESSEYVQALREAESAAVSSPEGKILRAELDELSKKAKRSEAEKQRLWELDTGESLNSLEHIPFYIALAGPNDIATVMGVEPSSILSRMLNSSPDVTIEYLEVIRGILKRRTPIDGNSSGNSEEDITGIFPDGTDKIPADIVAFTHWVLEQKKQDKKVSRKKLAQQFIEQGKSNRESADSLSKAFGQYLSGRKPCRIDLPPEFQ